MNEITQGKINIEQATTVLRRKGMSGIANLLQCLHDNAVHQANHRVSFGYIGDDRVVSWKEMREVSDASHDEHIDDLSSRKVLGQYYNIQA